MEGSAIRHLIAEIVSLVSSLGSRGRRRKEERRKTEFRRKILAAKIAQPPFLRVFSVRPKSKTERVPNKRDVTRVNM